jgi:EmrB/QacA subfamily drug resistance transporter
MSTVDSNDSLQAKPQTIREIMAPLIAIIFGLFMVVLDNTAVNVALPGLVKDFNSSLSTMQWAVTGYALAQAAVIPLSGWLSDRFGAKQIFLISVSFFTVGSFLCALATDPTQLIAYRVIQGIGGGMVMPIAMAFIYRLSPPDKVGAVMGMLGIPILLAPALGPVLAGWLVDYVSWQWIFIINIPIGIVGVIIGIRSLPRIVRQSVASLDVLGMLLGPLAFASLAYGVSEGGTDWTSTKTITGIAVGVVALLLFIIVELRQKQPMLELRVFRSFNFSRAIVIQWVSQIALFGTMFMIPLFLQQAKGFTAFHSGLTMLPQALAAAIFMPISGRLFDKIGARPLVMAGMSIVTVAAFLLTHISGTDTSSALILPLALLGAGMGLAFMPLNTHLIQAAPQNLVGRVTSLTSAAQQVMTSFSVAGLATVLTSHITSRTPQGTKPTLDIMASSFADTFLVTVGIALLGVILAVTLSKPTVSSENAEAALEAKLNIG